MNPKSIFQTMVSGRKGPRIAGRTILGIILVATFLLTAAIVYSRAATPQIARGGSAVDASLVSNPELMLARRYAAAQGQMPDQALLAANPELALARRNGLSSQTYLAANPELNLARRYAAVKKPEVSTLFAANPELSLVSRIVTEQNRTDTSSHLLTVVELRQARLYAAHRGDGRKAPSLDANPELSLVHRSAVNQNQTALQADVSTNPELNLVRRFGKEMEKNARWEYLADNPELFLVHRYASTISKR